MATLMRQETGLAPFTMIDDSNTATITLNNPFTGHTEMLSTLADYRCIANVVLQFALQQDIKPMEVEYSILWPEHVTCDGQDMPAFLRKQAD